MLEYLLLVKEENVKEVILDNDKSVGALPIYLGRIVTSTNDSLGDVIKDCIKDKDIPIEKVTAVCINCPEKTELSFDL